MALLDSPFPRNAAVRLRMTVLLLKQNVCDRSNALSKSCTAGEKGCGVQGAVPSMLSVLALLVGG